MEEENESVAVADLPEVAVALDPVVQLGIERNRMVWNPYMRNYALFLDDEDDE